MDAKNLIDERLERGIGSGMFIPVLLRTASGRKPTEGQLRDLVEKIKRAKQIKKKQKEEKKL